MHFINLDSETDFEGWRTAARELALNDVAPADVTWTVRGHEAELLAPLAVPLSGAGPGGFNVPAKFVELATSAILHREPGRFAMLYGPVVAAAGKPRRFERRNRS